MKKYFSIFFVIALLTIIIAPVQAAKLDLSLDYENYLNVMEFRSMDSLLDVFTNGLLSVDLKYIDKSATLNLGLSSISFEHFFDPFGSNNESIYIGLDSTYVDAFYSFGKSPLYNKYLANDDTILGLASSFSANTLLTDSVPKIFGGVPESILLSPLGYDTTYPAYTNAYLQPIHSAGLGLTFDFIKSYTFFGTFQAKEGVLNALNPLMIDNSALANGQMTVFSSTNSLLFNKYIGLNLNLLSILNNSILVQFTTFNEFEFSLTGAIPAFGGTYTLGYICRTLGPIDSPRYNTYFGEVANMLLTKDSSVNYSLGVSYNEAMNPIQDNYLLTKMISDFEIPYYKITAKFGIKFGDSNSFNLLNKLYIAEDNDFYENFIENVTSIALNTNIGKIANLNIDLYNDFHTREESSEKLFNNFNNLSATVNFNINKNVSLGANLNNMLTLYTNNVGELKIYDMISAKLWANASWIFKLSNAFSLNLDCAALGGIIYPFGDDARDFFFNNINANNSFANPSYSSAQIPYEYVFYYYDAYVNLGLSYLDKVALNASVFVGDDLYTRTSVRAYDSNNIINNIDNAFDNKLSIVASVNLKYNIFKNLTLSATGTYRNWDKDLNVYSFYNDYGTPFAIEDNFFVNVKLSFFPVKWTEIYAAWGKTGLANPSSFDDNTSGQVWSKLSVVPTYGNMDYSAIEVGVKIHF